MSKPIHGPEYLKRMGCIPSGKSGRYWQLPDGAGEFTAEAAEKILHENAAYALDRVLDLLDDPDLGLVDCEPCTMRGCDICNDMGIRDQTVPEFAEVIRKAIRPSGPR